MRTLDKNRAPIRPDHRPPTSVHRRGWLRTVAGWLILSVTFLVSLWLAAAAVLAFAEGYTQDALFFLFVAVAGLWLMPRIRRWSRG